MELADALETLVTKPWDEIDDFIFSLYGLDEHDATVVRDTVTFCGPYHSVREPAERPAGSEDLEIFRGYLEDMLQPLFQVADQKCAVRVLDAGEWYPPWRFVSVALAGDQLGDTHKLLKRLMVEASKTGASRIALRVPNGGLLVGILNQRRFGRGAGHDCAACTSSGTTWMLFLSLRHECTRLLYYNSGLRAAASPDPVARHSHHTSGTCEGI